MSWANSAAESSDSLHQPPMLRSTTSASGHVDLAGSANLEAMTATHENNRMASGDHRSGHWALASQGQALCPAGGRTRS